MLITERITLGDASSRRRTADGYLVATGRAARTGVQIYRGADVGRPEIETVRVYRPEGEVFARDSLSSYAYKPVTDDHPDRPVTADNWKDKAVGFVGEEVARDGEHVRIPLMLADASAIEKLENGKSELSAGYAVDLEWTAGQTEQGEQYDAIQRKIRINHVALVDAGRAGTARIDDGGKQHHASGNKGKPEMAEITVDGRPVSGPGADLIRSLLKLHDAAGEKEKDMEKKEQDQEEERKRDMEKERERDAEGKKREADKEREEDAGNKHEEDAEVNKLRRELDEMKRKAEEKDGEIAALKKRMPTSDSITAMVAEHAEVVSQARQVLGDSFDAKGKSAEDIRRDVVVAQLGDEAKEMTDAAIAGAYQAVVKSADPLRSAFAGGGRVISKDSAPEHLVAHQEYVQGLQDAWKEGR